VPYSQSVAFEAKLEQAGVPTILITVDGGGHGGGLGPSVTRAVEAFLGAQFLGEGSGLSDATFQKGGVRSGTSWAQKIPYGASRRGLIPSRTEIVVYRRRRARAKAPARAARIALEGSGPMAVALVIATN